MKIITWNCNGAFRKKFEFLRDYNADIIVVQECENPESSGDKSYKEWATNCIWTGDTSNKGLGLFARDEIKIEKLNWRSGGLKHFIACRVNNDFNFLGTWCHRSGSTFSYIGQLWKYLQNHKAKLKKSIIAGDLNSNVFWDQPKRCWNHSDVVRELKELNIESLYHGYFNEEQGKESQPTFYLYKNRSKPYHIDYIFASQEFARSVKEMSIGHVDRWLKMSDHLPIFCEMN